MNCQAACFEATLPSCPDLIVLNAGLVPATNYEWELTTRHNIIYSGTATSAAGTGKLTIDIEGSEIPKGLLNEFAGQVELKVWKVNNATEREAAVFTINELEYECMMISFMKSIPLAHHAADAPIYVQEAA